MLYGTPERRESIRKALPIALRMRKRRDVREGSRKSVWRCGQNVAKKWRDGWGRGVCQAPLVVERTIDAHRVGSGGTNVLTGQVSQGKGRICVWIDHQE